MSTNTVADVVSRRFTHYVRVEPSGCWMWRRLVDKDGYGKVQIGGKSLLGHRVFFTHFKGPIPPGLELDHLCRRPGCVNPEHLEPVTRRENCLRGTNPCAENARRTKCVNGHPLVAPNMRIIYSEGRLKRRCRACVRDRMRQFRARAKVLGEKS